MTLLKLLDCCYKNGLAATFQYDAKKDVMVLDILQRSTNKMVSRYIPMCDLIDGEFASLIIDSQIEDCMELITEAMDINMRCNSVIVESITKRRVKK